MTHVSRLARGSAVPLAYAALSVVLYGRSVLAHPGRSLVGTGVDPQIFVWSIAWWPHALLHGLNPIVTHAVWAPIGVNLAWTTSVAGIALPLAPVTLAFGPVVAYNVAALALPALAATTAYLLCLRLTGSRVASLIGGAFFGFSPYMAGHEEGHLHMSSVFLVPLGAIAMLDFLDGKRSRRASVVLIGALLAWQLLLSTEVLLTATLALAVGLLLAFLLIPDRRSALRSALAPLAAAYGLAGACTAPFVWYALRHFETGSINRPADFPADLANLIVPTRLALLITSWTVTKSDRFVGNLSENGAYIGLPALGVVAVVIAMRWREPRIRFLAVAASAGVVAELGTALHVMGHSLVVLPWRAFSAAPGLSNVLPVRLSAFVALTVAIFLALFVAGGPRTSITRIGIAAAALVVVLPSPTSSGWRGTIDRPSFFTSALESQCLRPGENVLALPYTNQTAMMVWQAEARFHFRLANGNLRPDPPVSIPHRESVLVLDSGGDVDTISAGDIAAIATAQGVSTILVDDAHASPWTALLTGQYPSQHLGGVTLYRVVPGPATCPS